MPVEFNKSRFWNTRNHSLRWPLSADELFVADANLASTCSSRVPDRTRKLRFSGPALHSPRAACLNFKLFEAILKIAFSPASVWPGTSNFEVQRHHKVSASSCRTLVCGLKFTMLFVSFANRSSLTDHLFGQRVANFRCRQITGSFVNWPASRIYCFTNGTRSVVWCGEKLEQTIRKTIVLTRAAPLGTDIRSFGIWSN